MTSVYEAPHGMFEGENESGALADWRGPGGSTLLSWEVDFRVGGASRIFVRSPEGPEYWVEDAYLEIVEPERIVFTGTLGAGGERTTGRASSLTFRRT